MDWDLATLANVATAVAVFAALVFGILQIRQMAGQRRETTSIELINKLLTPEFIAGLDLILQLPPASSPARIRGDPALRLAVLHVDFTYETAGVLVYERMVPLHVVDRMTGGMLRAGWERVRPYIEEERRLQGRENPGEWWQWLYERVKDDPAPGKEQGAHVAFSAWRR